MKTDPNKKSLFTLANGENLMFTFILVSSLFLLWGFCNGMIDVMDKHFQDELGLSKSQSAWVQFAHYLGYFLMAMPAGWLASKLGYKGSIIAGLLMVAIGGFWFLPATYIDNWAQRRHVAYDRLYRILAGVCTIAAGFTFLETVANPYTTVLGPPEYAATRIDLAQSCNGIGWLLGPILGGLFFYAKDESGHGIGSELLYIPYMTVAFVVLTLSVIFYFSYIPDVKTKDDYHLDENDEAAGKSATIERELHRGLIYLLLLFNVSVLVCVASIFLWLILSAFDIADKLVGIVTFIPIASYVRVTSGKFLADFHLRGRLRVAGHLGLCPYPNGRKVTHHSIWSHPHFSGSSFAQFLYVAAQAGIFSFFINYMTAEVPPVPGALQNNWTKAWIGTKTAMANEDVKDLSKLADKLEKKADPISEYVCLNLSPSTIRSMAEFKASSGDNVRSLRSLLVLDMNMLINQDPHKMKKEKADKKEKRERKEEAGKKETAEEKAKREKKEKIFYDPTHFTGIKLSENTQKLLTQKLKEDKEAEAKAAAEEKMSDEEKQAAKAKKPAEQEPEKINTPLLNRMLLQDSFAGILNYQEDVLTFTEKGAAFLLTIGFICFLTGRFTGAAMMRKYSAHKILGIFGVMNVIMCLLIFAKLGWLSVLCVFLSFYFMSIMFPTIFALGIFGLGARAKKASAFLVMAIMGGAVLPKLMGQVADLFDMSRGFIVPLGCFAMIGLYGFLWPRFNFRGRA